MAPRVAFVHDALPFYGGAERTLEAMLEIFPAAPVFTLVHAPERFSGTALGDADIRPAFLNRLPGIHRNHYRYFPLFPAAVRAFDLSGYDVVISSHYAFAHWVKTRPGQKHFCYVHTPLRYIWQYGDVVLQKVPGPIRPVVRVLQGRMRQLDRESAAFVSRFAANSQFMAGLVEQAYARHSDVIYPPVDVGRFAPNATDRDGFVCVSRLARHKQLDVVVRAFNRLGIPLEIIGAGPELRRLQSIAAGNVTFSGRLSDAEVAERLARAQGFVHMAAEDFGIAIVEAQAAGCPVIAFRGGANSETVLDGVTGLLVPEQTPEALEHVVGTFLGHAPRFEPGVIRAHAAGFSRERFKEQFQASVQSLL